MKSVTYWHPVIYKILMKVLFKRNYKRRYLEIANLIENNSSVIDICCGDAQLYSFLKNKKIKYTGIDFNNTFLNYLRNQLISS